LGRAKLEPSFFDRDAEAVAPELLGMILVRERPGMERAVGRIVETEAYLGPHDRAAHSARGPTARNASMFGPPGLAYVYFIYGMHHCLNVVTGPGTHPSAVLIRALEPVAGITMRTDGPGRLCRVLEVDRALDGHDLGTPPLWLEAGPGMASETIEVATGPRVGVGYAGEWALRPLRYWIRGNRHVSRG
jgi:DNA-3-methyladenine glycosylase